MYARVTQYFHRQGARRGAATNAPECMVLRGPNARLRRGRFASGALKGRAPQSQPQGILLPRTDGVRKPLTRNEASNDQQGALVADERTS